MKNWLSFYLIEIHWKLPIFTMALEPVPEIYSTIRKMGNKDNSRMNLEKTAVVLKSILAEEYFGVEI